MDQSNFKFDINILFTTKYFVQTFIYCFIFLNAQSQSKQEIEHKKITLPNGWSITKIGKSINLGDLPLNIAVSKSKKLIAVINSGESYHTLQLIDASKQIILDSFVIGKCWLGLAFSNDEHFLYASGGNDNCIVRFDVSHNKFLTKDTIVLGKPWPVLISPAGIALDDDRKILYVVTKENNSLYIVDLKEKNKIKQYELGAEGYTCILSADKKTLFISCWGCQKVKFFDTENEKFICSIVVGDHPNDMCISGNGKFLYVANANDNSVSVIDIVKRKVIEILNAALYADAPNGSTTNGVALSDDDKTLYIANADNNCLTVFNVSVPAKSVCGGFIPTGWYPTCVRVIGKNIFVTNGKGFSSKANPKGPNPTSRIEHTSFQQSGKYDETKVQYIGGLFKGTLSIIPVPKKKQLSIYSDVVYKNIPYTKEIEMYPSGKNGNPIPQKVGDASPIKYVFYIVKENRTYDQILGDIPQGNGDTSLVLFGEKVTPNLHALAREFVLLDNFYADGEVSADGHNWSMGAYATDFLEKNWPTSYGNRGGFYYAEGTREIANNKNGFIWDYCKRLGVTYRTYGEFADDYKPNIPVLKDHFCPYYTSWDQTVKDTTRFRQWKKDFDSLLAINKIPQLNTLRFINDHTVGLKLGGLSPAAQVADNDLAVGMFIEYLSKSKIWNESAVFILEDDAQNGPDHVDAHRTTAYLAGGFVKRNFVDHTAYSTSSMLRTIELILGLPPMSQYDAAATPMWRCFSDNADSAPFHSVGAHVDLNQKNLAVNHWQKMSETFDFSKEDRAPDWQLNEVLWFSQKGETIFYPAPVRAAFFVVTKVKDDD